MQQIYGILMTLIIYSAMLKFYSLIKNKSLQKLNFYLIPILHITYRFFTTGLMIEPLRMITSFIFIGIMLMLFEKKISWVILVVAFLMTYTLNLLSLLMALITLVSLGTENEFIYALVTLSWSIIVFVGVVLFNENRKITLSDYARYLEIALVRKIVFVIGLLIFMLHSFFHTSTRLGIEFDFITSIILWAISIILVLIIIFLTIFIVRYMNVERKKQSLLEQENVRLTEERLTIDKQMNELKQMQMTLQKNLEDVTSNYHNYKYLVPVLMSLQNKLFDEMQHFSEYSYDEKISRIKDYTDQIRTLSFGITDEFVVDHIKNEVTGLNIPNNWSKLNILLETFLKNAHNKGVYLSIYNYTSLWDGLNISDVIFIRLLSNLVDNAIKESCKIPESERGEVQVIFKEEEGYFGFEVRDGASEFELSILKNLGLRKNSTNGTGDGYAEIMLDLKQTQASFIIKEWQKNGKDGKVISIIFDGYGMMLIDSHYRQELLKDKLAATDFVIMDVY